MRILLTNDDGIYAPGLYALKAELALLGDVMVVAPRHEQSATSHSITVHSPLLHEEIYQDGKFLGHAINGSPADCVKLAVTQILSRPPEMVVSGINLGANVGINVFYSGTVAAAIEGAMFGIPSVAVSLVYSPNPDFKGASKIATRLIRNILSENREGIRLFNINLPHGDPSHVRGVRLTRQSVLGYDENFERRVDPRGRPYYWMTGSLPTSNAEGDSDLSALEQGFITITPLQYDLTHYENLKLAQSWNWDGDFS